MNHLRVCFVYFFQMGDGVSVQQITEECSAFLPSGNSIPCFLWFLISLEEDIQHHWLLSVEWSRGTHAMVFLLHFWDRLLGNAALTLNVMEAFILSLPWQVTLCAMWADGCNYWYLGARTGFLRSLLPCFPLSRFACSYWACGKLLS